MMTKNDDDNPTTEKPPKQKFIRFNYDVMWCAWNNFFSNRINVTVFLAGHHAFTYRNDLLFIASGMVIIVW